jgi:hypothetical protein
MRPSSETAFHQNRAAAASFDTAIKRARPVKAMGKRMMESATSFGG